MKISFGNFIFLLISHPFPELVGACWEPVSMPLCWTQARKQKQHVSETILSENHSYHATNLRPAAHSDQHVAGDVANDEGQAKPKELGTSFIFPRWRFPS